MKKKHDKVEEQKLNPEETQVGETQEETCEEQTAKQEKSLSFQKETLGKENNYLEDLQRVQAEFSNYMKRVEKERILLGDFAKRELLLKLLEIVDEFEVALNAMKNVEDKDEILKGVEMLHGKMRKILDGESVRVINALGNKFDPYHHDAIAQVDGNENVVIEEVKRGYMFKDKLLRASIVRVGNGWGNKANEINDNQEVGGENE